MPFNRLRSVTSGMAFLLAAGIHLGLVIWWVQRPVVVAPAFAMQSVTVDLLALNPPAGQLVQPIPPASEPEKPPETATQSEKPLLDESTESPVVQKPKRPEKKKLPEKPVQMAQSTKPVDTPTNNESSSADNNAVTSPSPLPISAARYDADYLRNPPPAYPPLSRRLGEEGKVLLRVQVSAEGEPLRVDIQTSSGYSRLDDAARKAALRWRFMPARQGGTALSSWVDVPVKFSLKQ